MWENFGYNFAEIVEGIHEQNLKIIFAIVGKILVSTEKFRLKLEDHEEIYWK